MRVRLIVASRNGGIHSVDRLEEEAASDCPICQLFVFEPDQRLPLGYRQTMNPALWRDRAYRLDASRYALSQRVTPRYCLQRNVFVWPDGYQNPLAHYVRYDLRRQLYQRHRSCERCHARGSLSIDHIIPFYRGGRTLPANLQVLCRRCNTEKGSDLPVIVDGRPNGRNMFQAVVSVLVWNTRHEAWER